jgi:hypothetical protein
MRQVSLTLSVSATGLDVRAAIQAATEAVGGRIAREGTLKSYPGSLHWHMQSPGGTGTIEATYWPERSALWASVHANREGNWAGVTFEQFVAHLQEWVVDLSSHAQE